MSGSRLLKKNLRHYSHTQIIHLKGTVQCFLSILITLCSSHQYLIPEHFHHFKRNLILISSQSPFPVPSNYYTSFSVYDFAYFGFII